MKLRKAIEQYLSHVKANHSENTLKCYTGRLNSLKKQLGKRKVKSLSANDIREWLERASRWEDGSLKAPDTRRLTMIAWEQLQKYLIEHELIEEPIHCIKQKPGGRKRDRVPTRDEQAQVLRLARQIGKREFADMYRSLRQCGARPGELVSANIDDYEPAQNLILLKQHKTAAKTGDVRRIGVGKLMARIIDRSAGDRTTGPIFRDEKGQRWTTQKLSRIYSSLRDRLGLPKDLVLYCTRHEHGTKVCERHGIHAAAHSLGHRNISTTQRYCHPDHALLARYQDSI